MLLTAPAACVLKTGLPDFCVSARTKQLPQLGSNKGIGKGWLNAAIHFLILQYGCDMVIVAAVLNTIEEKTYLPPFNTLRWPLFTSISVIDREGKVCHPTRPRLLAKNGCDLVGI